MAVTTWLHWGTSWGKAWASTRANSTMAATLGAAERSAVTGVGAPSYTSGVHMWNGAADTLKARPQIRNTRPNTMPMEAGPCTAPAMSANRVEPAKP